MVYCLGRTIQWVNYFILSCLLGFLLALHCIMYKKLNKRWSCRVFKRNRVQVLSLSLLLTTIQFFKMTFMMDYADLFMLLLAQLIRFLIWALTLRNFLKSGMDLMVKTSVTKLIVFVTKVSTIVGATFFTLYGIYMLVEENFEHKDVLSFRSPEFIIQASLNMFIVLIFLFSACSTSKMIKA